MIKTVSIMGAGSIGGMLSTFFHKAYPDHFSILAKGCRAERLRAGGIRVNGHQISLRVIDSREEAPDLLVLCVKNYDLEQAIADTKDVLTQNTIILPLLNGISATERLKEVFPCNTVLYGIIMRTDTERKNGETTFTVTGEVQFGERKNETFSEAVKAVKECLDKAGIPNRVYPDMLYMLWRKWMVNIGANQISILTEAQFKYFQLIPEIQDAVRAAISEVYPISVVAGAGLNKEEVDNIITEILHYPPEKKSSMLQDLEARRPTEIDYFAGTVIKLGNQYSIPTPVNDLLYKLIKTREKIFLEQNKAQNRKSKTP